MVSKTALPKAVSAGFPFLSPPAAHDTIGGMDIVDREIEGYLERVGGSQDPIFSEMEDQARKTEFPIVGPLVGRLLLQLAQLIGARRVLELGSGFGYSACWFQQALGSEGELLLTDWSKENLDLAEENVQRSGFAGTVRVFPGDALETLRGLGGEFDVIFNDTKKAQYPEVLRQCAPRLGRGGLLISDNVLWHGRVLDSKPDPDTQAVLEYNRLIFSSPEFFSVIIPLRDGVSVSRKL